MKQEISTRSNTRYETLLVNNGHRSRPALKWKPSIERKRKQRPGQADAGAALTTCHPSLAPESGGCFKSAHHRGWWKSWHPLFLGHLLCCVLAVPLPSHLAFGPVTPGGIYSCRCPPGRTSYTIWRPQYKIKMPGPLFKKLLRMSRWQQHSIKSTMGPLWMWGLCECSNRKSMKPSEPTGSGDAQPAPSPTLQLGMYGSPLQVCSGEPFISMATY